MREPFSELGPDEVYEYADAFPPGCQVEIIGKARHNIPTHNLPTIGTVRIHTNCLKHVCVYFYDDMQQWIGYPPTSVRHIRTDTINRFLDQHDSDPNPDAHDH